MNTLQEQYSRSAQYDVEIPDDLAGIGTAVFESTRGYFEIPFYPHGFHRDWNKVAVRIHRGAELGDVAMRHELLEGRSDVWHAQIVIDRAEFDWNSVPSPRNAEEQSKRAQNFAQAILAASTFATSIAWWFPQMNLSWEARREVYERGMAEKQAEREAKMAGDPAIGWEVAGDLLNMARGTLSDKHNGNINIKLIERGSPTWRSVYLKREWGGPIVIRTAHGGRISKERARELIAEASVRSVEPLKEAVSNA